MSVPPVVDHVVADDRDLAVDAAGDLGDRRPGRAPGRVLCMIAKSASSISAKRTATFARPASGATETTSVAVEAEVAEVPREERQRGHVVDRDREEALDLARVQVHRQHAVDAGELEHVGDEAAPRSARAASPCGPGASTGTTGSPR